MDRKEIENEILALAIRQVEQTKAFLGFAALAQGSAAGKALETLEGLSVVIAYALFGIAKLLPRELSEAPEEKKGTNSNG